MDKSAQSIGDQIRAYRTTRGLTQRDLAQEIGVSQQTVADWEAGRAEKTLGIMRRLFFDLFRWEQQQRAMDL